MKVQAVKRFLDIENNVIRNPGETFDAGEKRVKKLVAYKVAEVVQEKSNAKKEAAE